MTDPSIGGGNSGKQIIGDNSGNDYYNSDAADLERKRLQKQDEILVVLRRRCGPFVFVRDEGVDIRTAYLQWVNYIASALASHLHVEYQKAEGTARQMVQQQYQVAEGQMDAWLVRFNAALRELG